MNEKENDFDGHIIICTITCYPAVFIVAQKIDKVQRIVLTRTEYETNTGN